MWLKLSLNFEFLLYVIRTYLLSLLLSQSRVDRCMEQYVNQLTYTAYLKREKSWRQPFNH